MILEERMACAFNRALSGERIDESAGPWNISASYVDTLIFNLFYKWGSNFADYIFQVEFTDGNIQFRNYHRRAKKGRGTFTLSQLHRAFRILARHQDGCVQVCFPTFGQADTERWLVRNQYNRNNDGVYVRLFYPYSL